MKHPHWKNWTRPYCGISHRDGLARGIQITVQFSATTEDWARVYLLISRSYNKNEEDVFSAKAEFRGTYDQAFKFGEKLAKKYLDISPS